MTDALPDPATAFGARVRRRFADDQVAWLTSVDAGGTPQPNPVWFVLLDDGDVLVYCQPKARRLRHVHERPHVSLHFNSDDGGGDIIVLTGTAEVDPGFPLAHEFPPYVEKYGAAAARISGDVEAFANDYRVALRIRLAKTRGF
jgi:PPOX class probable F420-dependent enzyme